MSFNAIIGALGVVLGLDKAEFEGGLNAAQKHLVKTGKEFERLGGRLEAIGTRLTIGLTAPLGALGVTAVKAATESRQAFGQVESALASMGAASGKTAGELKKAAADLQDLSTFDDDDILRKVTANLLTFGNVSGEAFDRAQLAAVNLSARLGQDLQSSAIQVGKALNDPVKGVTALQRVGVSFTETQRKQIEAMTEAGDVAGAQALILGELEKQFGGAAAAMRKASPDADFQQSWRDFTEVVGEIALKVLPPLTNALSTALDWFNRLPEPVQTGAVAAAALLAVIGPIVTVVGGLTTAIGASLPVIAALGPGIAAVTTAAAGLAAAFAASLPVVASWGAAIIAATWPIAAIAAAVAGVVLVWKNWDKIEPILRKLYQGVKTWLMDKLGAAMKWVEDKVKAVGDAFYKLWDRVVGHSYVPDLVDGIEEHFARLDGVMVDPALAANDNVAEAFARTAEDVARSVDSIFRSLRNRDWAGAVSGLTQAIQGIQFAFQSGGLTGGATAVGSALGAMVGGKAGSAISGGLGIAGLGASLGTTLGSLGGALSVGGSLASVGTLGLGSALTGVAGLLGPIGIAAGAAYALAKLFNVGGKPSNHGAGFDLVTGQLSGNKRNAETEKAVTAAGDAIRQGQLALEEAGLKLGTTVNGLVIGTRDLTQVYLNNGRTLTAAVGDSAAAVDVALRAVLDGAEYASAAQEAYVRSMLAAGKGFEDVLAGLQRFELAQSLPQQLADEILRLTDPAAYDTDQLKREQEARRKAIADQVEEGLLTADQLAGINVQLEKLEKLELDALLKRYADSVETATAEAEDLADDLDQARDEQVRALERQAAEVERVADRFRAIADNLADFRRDLSAEILGGRPGRGATAAGAAFNRLAALAQQGDADAMAALPDAGRAWIDAFATIAPDAMALQRVRAQVLAGVTKAEAAARQQASQADAQAAALQQQIDLLSRLDLSVQAVETAIHALTAATDAHALAQMETTQQLVGMVAAQRAELDALAERQDAALQAVLADQNAFLARLVVNTGQTSRYLDDVTQGGDALRTVAA